MCSYKSHQGGGRNHRGKINSCRDYNGSPLLHKDSKFKHSPPTTPWNLEPEKNCFIRQHSELSISPALTNTWPTSRGQQQKRVSGGETHNFKGHCGHFSITHSHYQEGPPLKTLRAWERILSKNTLLPSCLTHSCTNPQLPHSETCSKVKYIISLYFLITWSMISPRILSYPAQVLLQLMVTLPIRKGPGPTLRNGWLFPFLPQGSTWLLLIFPAMAHLKNPRMVSSTQCGADALLLTPHGL